MDRNRKLWTVRKEAALSVAQPGKTLQRGHCADWHCIYRARTFLIRRRRATTCFWRGLVARAGLDLAGFSESLGTRSKRLGNSKTHCAHCRQPLETRPLLPLLIDCDTRQSQIRRRASAVATLRIHLISLPQRPLHGYQCLEYRN